MRVDSRPPSSRRIATPHATMPVTLWPSQCAPADGRRLTDDPEIPDLVAGYLRAERDLARARASVERLVALCRPLAEQIARTYAARDADVADIVQDALLALVRDLPRLQNPGAFRSWFATLVHNRCRDWLRRRRVRQAEQSLDSPPRPGWLGASEGPQPLDVPDPAAARAFLDLEATDQLARLLRVVPAQQRTALTLAYLEDRSHEEIGHALGVSPRAAEGLVYRGLRRVQAVAAQCTEEPEALTVWCPHCGQHRLIAQLLPGVGPAGPLWRRWRCPGCGLASHWTEHNVVPLARYPSVEASWWHEREQWGKEPQHLARASGLRCWKCGAPVHRRDRPPATTRQGRPWFYVLHWSCFKCDVGTYWGFHSFVVTGFLPEWLAFWRSAPHLLLEPEHLVRAGGEERVVITAQDPDTGRRATLAVARETLEIRRFEVEGR